MAAKLLNTEDRTIKAGIKLFLSGVMQVWSSPTARRKQSLITLYWSLVYWSFGEERQTKVSLSSISKVAGYLKRFCEAWKEIADNEFVLGCIKGYIISFNPQVRQEAEPRVVIEKNEIERLFGRAIYGWLG
ncbi:hypothetical protein KQX54_005541 [Cotesia glomerata]|uniref:Uncharacterized protein n=1 Tax=Cotesia glomerata TaxID=32391 RepID=A0AAV7IUU7_COTGL|nr:hypothetical protein KQX54_005541 [Cotesia glomerata]